MISPCGLFWVAKIPDGGLNFSSDGKTATLEMKSVAVFDQPTFPALDAPATPAEMNFKIVWKATDEPIAYDDPQKKYRVTGFKATVQMEASVKIPSRKFSWKSDPLETSRTNFAIIGDEVNGRYYN